MPKIGWLLILSALTGCAVGPNYHVVVPKVPEHWDAGLNQNLKQLHPEDLKTWWRNFGDAEFDKLMARALKGNLDLKISLARIEQARAERRGASAELFPTVNSTSGVQRQSNPFPGLAPGIKYNMFEIGFDALWEVDLFGQKQRRLESASAELDAADEEYRQSLVSLSAELARSYVEYRSQQNQLRITRSNLETQQRTLALTIQLFNEGVTARHDVVRARAQAEITAAQIPLLEANLIACQRQLEVLIGQQPGALTAELHSPGKTPAVTAQKLLASPAQTIRYRPDVRASERRLAAATAMEGVAIAELFPKISLSAFLGLRNTGIESLFKSAAFSYGTAANFMQPLLNFGRIQAGIDLAKAKQKEAYLAYEKAVIEALKETETTLTRYLKEEVRRQALDSSVANLQESVRLSQLRYQEGVISFLEVLDAQRALYSVEIDLARSQAATSANLIAFYKSLGGGANVMFE